MTTADEIDPQECQDDILKPLQRFEHARYIVGSPKARTVRPDVCTITRVTASTIYYQTETGMRMKQDRSKFVQSVKRFLHS